MKKYGLIVVLTLVYIFSFAQNKSTWVVSTQTEHLQLQKQLPVQQNTHSSADVEVLLKNPQQTIDGFGTCFNELGWESLSLLKPSDREAIMAELFSPGKGANFTICRMPVGANDFSKNWYSYDETKGDFAMQHFSIENDKSTLIPFIKNALKYNPALKLWASPWSPPTWMKTNNHYAARSIPDVTNWPKDQLEKMRNEWGMDFKGISNGLKPEQERREGSDMFIQEEKYFKAYSLYFANFIKAYRSEKINIGMVMPQNEFNSNQVFPSCTWTAKGLSNFLNDLVPEMNQLGVDVFFGTMERANYKLVDTILSDKRFNKSIKGVGFQWAGKDAIPAIHKEYPQIKLYQSEQECGNGFNDWKYCNYAWGLMKHYLNNGANAYMYWNTALKEGGISTWGWHQNSLVTIDPVHKTYQYNYEYYLLKHLSHFVKPGAKRLETKGKFENILAFINKDNSVVIMVQNETGQAKTIRIKIGDKMIEPTLQADSYNSFFLF